MVDKGLLQRRFHARSEIFRSIIESHWRVTSGPRRRDEIIGKVARSRDSEVLAVTTCILRVTILTSNPRTQMTSAYVHLSISVYSISQLFWKSFTPSTVIDMSKERDWPASLGTKDKGL